MITDGDSASKNAQLSPGVLWRKQTYAGEDGEDVPIASWQQWAHSGVLLVLDVDTPSDVAVTLKLAVAAAPGDPHDILTDSPGGAQRTIAIPGNGRFVLAFTLAEWESVCLAYSVQLLATWVDAVDNATIETTMVLKS